MKPLYVLVPSYMHAALKLYSSDRDTSITKIVVEAIEEWLEKQQNDRPVSE